MERAPQTLVVDASVVAKWFLEEEDTQNALQIRDAHSEGRVNLIAPDLLVYEVANALSYNKKVSENDLTGSIHDLFSMDLELIPPSSEYSTRTARMARRLSISIYDGSYIALADLTATNLITADKKLHGKLSKTCRLLLIAELDNKWTLP